MEAPLLIKKEDLEAAVEAGVLRGAELEGLTRFLAQRYEESPEAAAKASACSGTTVLYYIGGALGFGAAISFTALIANDVGPGGQVVLAAAYAIAMLLIANFFQGKRQEVPSAIFATLASVMAAVTMILFIEAAKMLRNDYVVKELIVMSTGLAAAALLLQRFKYPLLTLPVACWALALCLDVLPRIMFEAPSEWGKSSSWEEMRDKRMGLSYVLGCITLGIAVHVDIQNIRQRDFGFWLTLSGLATYTASLWHFGVSASCFTFEGDNKTANILPRFVCLALHAALIPFGAAVSRRSVLFVGAFGVFGGVMSFAGCYVPDGIMAVLTLTALAGAFVGLGLLWSRSEKAISASLRTLLPAKVRELGDSRNGW